MALNSYGVLKILGKNCLILSDFVVAVCWWPTGDESAVFLGRCISGLIGLQAIEEPNVKAFNRPHYLFSGPSKCSPNGTHTDSNAAHCLLVQASFLLFSRTEQGPGFVLRRWTLILQPEETLSMVCTSHKVLVTRQCQQTVYSNLSLCYRLT